MGNTLIGGNAPISIQSMTNTDTRDIETTLEQIHNLEKAGCEIVRVAVVDDSAAQAIKAIKSNIKIPLVADIHFDHKLAISAMENGADGIRINPGNIGNNEKVKRVIDAAKLSNVAIRIGVNSGSLEKDLLKKYGVTAEALVESAAGHLRFFEDNNFDNIKFSLKASNVNLTIKAYEMFSKKYDYPLHIGVTEAGTLFSGTVKSAVGIGAILSRGIGDTLRVSLTGDPVQEIRVAWEILKSLELREKGPEIISCPTCGRTEIELIKLAEQVENALMGFESTVSVAVMGCPVNGPGEAREADYGIAGGRGNGLIFKKGEIIKKVNEKDLLNEFLKLLASEGIK
jgi:(E)-4-hydroxy-3-methylbut-2-enyl-diphosphate synthase